ncbi:MAG: helix-turn-helix domain-containing protein [Gammaproteobacteria bacterium]|nr:helix-turn-helix domain-containing protein [Gammaproteobacteria bacterium]
MVENEIEKEPVLIGAILKEHREKQDYSIGQVANQLHLDNRVITAIENDDHDSLPDPIYVRGYIRGYCKLLNLDTEEILALYKESARRDDPEIIPEIKYPTQSSSSDKPVKAFTYLISLGLVLLVIAWWQSNFIISGPSSLAPEVSESQPAEETAIEEQTAEPLEEINISQYVPFTGYMPDYPMDITITPGVAETQVVNPFATSEDHIEVDGQIMDEISDHFMSETDLGPSIIDSEERQAISTGNDTEAEEDETPPSTGPDTLVLTINADSWIEIFDVNEQKIYFDLGRTGEELTLKGTAPFDILLGFAQGVSIEYNGNSVDQAPYTRAGVARFTLGD